MPENFKCGVCFKGFKTNQHLTQHKNRKKKCCPPIHDMDNFSIASSVTTTPLFNFPVQNYQYQTPRLNQTPTLDYQDENHCSIFSTKSSTKSDLTFNQINIPNNMQTTTVMDLFTKYKETLDENKKLENNILDLKTQLMNTNTENILLRRRWRW